MDMMDGWGNGEAQSPLDKTRTDINNAINKCISDLRKQNIEDADIIVRKVNGKYIAKVDKKRDLKIEEIFKDKRDGK